MTEDEAHDFHTMWIGLALGPTFDLLDPATYPSPEQFVENLRPYIVEGPHQKPSMPVWLPGLLRTVGQWAT